MKRLWAWIRRLFARRRIEPGEIVNLVEVPETGSTVSEKERPERYYTARQWRKIKTRRRMTRESRRRNRSK